MPSSKPNFSRLNRPSPKKSKGPCSSNSKSKKERKSLIPISKPSFFIRSSTHPKTPLPTSRPKSLLKWRTPLNPTKPKLYWRPHWSRRSRNWKSCQMRAKFKLRTWWKQYQRTQQRNWSCSEFWFTKKTTFTKQSKRNDLSEVAAQSPCWSFDKLHLNSKWKYLNESPD